MNAVLDVLRCRGLGGQFFPRRRWAGLAQRCFSVAVGLSLSVGTGCSRTETKAEPQASASAAGSAGAVMQLTEYCPKVCQRAADCGLERAKKLAEISRGDDLKLIESAKGRQKEHYFVCKRQCEAEPIQWPQEAEYERATQCLKLDDCAKFEACLHGDWLSGGPAAATKGAATKAEPGAKQTGASQQEQANE